MTNSRKELVLVSGGERESGFRVSPWRPQQRENPAKQKWPGQGDYQSDKRFEAGPFGVNIPG
jgi:hypothetical protein